MIATRAAVAVAKVVVQTGNEFFAEFLETSVFNARVAPVMTEMTAIFTRTAEMQLRSEFVALLETGADNIVITAELEAEHAAALAAVEGAAGRSLAAKTVQAGIAEIAGGAGGTIGAGSKSFLRTAVEGGARGFVIGLVLAAVQYAIARVRVWKASISIGSAHALIFTKLVDGILNASRDFDPELKPWPEPWPGTQAKPGTAEDRKKRNGEKRFRRMQRARTRG